MRATLFQTLENRDNPEEIEKDGPFLCRRRTAWLGDGYYFWDSDIKLAHWWGKRNSGHDYMICSAEVIFDDSCWDLHGNGSHLNDFRNLVEEMIKLKVAKPNEILVVYVIKFYKSKGAFNYRAIRAVAYQSFGQEFYDWIGKTIVYFHKEKPGFLDMHPLIQVCLIDKAALSLHDYKVVYPALYASDMLI